LRKFLTTALVGAIAVFGYAFLGGGVAHASPACWGGGEQLGPVSVNGTQSGTGGFAQICLSGLPVNGTVTAYGDAASQQGYIVADGDDSNQGASAGYIGISSKDNGIVGCASGDYNNEGTGAQPSGDNNDDPTTPEGSTDNDANNQLLPLPTDPNFQSDLQSDLAALQAQTGPCAVGTPAP
jgi:hypothetical protein